MDNLLAKEVHESQLETTDEAEQALQLRDAEAPETSEACDVEQTDNEVCTKATRPAGHIVHGLRLFSLKELNNIPVEENNSVVDGLLPTSGTSILHGKPKRGKSTLARQLAVSVSQGKPFLGRETLQGPVLYIALEEKPSEVALHFRLLGSEEDDPIITLTDVGRSDLAKVLLIVESLKPVLVIVDTLAKFLHLNKINDYGPVNESLRWMHEAARSTGAHFLAVHHAKKTSGDDPMDSLIGSTAFAGGVDTVIGLTESRGTRMIQTNQRYGTSLEETALHFDPDTRSMSLGNTTSQEEGEQKRQTREIVSDEIVQFVESHPGRREIEIVNGVTGKGETKKNVLRELLLSRLRREGTGHAGDPFLYFADVPVEPSTTTVTN